MTPTSRRGFLGTSSLLSAGYFVAAGSRTAWSTSANEQVNVACIGVGGKGSSDSDNAALFGNVIAICDVDRNTLESKGKAEKFQDAERFTDFRELLAKHGKKIDMCTISTPDHMHAPATLEAMRLGISCYTQKPLTRTIYEARLLTKVAKEMADKGVVTQMGNQGTALDSSREAIAQLKSGVLGPLKEVYAWSNRPVWAQGPGRRMDVRKYQTQAMKEVDEQEDSSITAEEVAEIVSDLVSKKQKEIGKALERVDWKAWLGVAPSREYWPGLYHAFQHRGWWDFGTGALGDMACHQLTVPYAACGLRDPI
jgi:predicted dehydrogenase